MKNFYITFAIFFLFYLVIPTRTFPQPPENSLQSDEPADIETTLRRSYFTNFEREDVVVWYLSQMKHSLLFNFPYTTFRLNYPPEDAQTIIRDQTRSSYLEEIVHPFRESLYINGFKPKQEKDAIIIGGKKWVQKITVRYVASSLILRLVLGILTISFIPFLFNSYLYTFKDLTRMCRQRLYENK